MSAERTMNRDEVLKIWRLGGCEGFVSKCEELVFDAFSDFELVDRALEETDVTVSFSQF